MKTIYLSIFFVFLSSFSFSQSKLTRSHKSIDESVIATDKNVAEEYVSVNLISSGNAELFSVVKTINPKTVFDLSDKGQKSLIEAVNSKASKMSELISGLQNNLSKNSSSISYNKKYTTYLKKIEIDVNDNLRGSERSGRIDELVIRIKLPDNKSIKFKSLQNISTKYEYISFGKIGLTRNQSFTANAGVNFAGTGSTVSTGNSTTNKQVVIDGDTLDITDVIGETNEMGTSNTSNIGISYTGGRTISEEREIKKRRIAMKGSLTSNEIVIYQEGAPELNLNDKIVIEVLFEVTNQYSTMNLEMNGLFDNKGNANTDTLKQKLSPLYVTTASSIVSSTDIQAEISHGFVYREIVNNKGKKSPGEWDDKVKFIKLADNSIVSSKQNLINKGEIDIDEWVIEDTTTNEILCLDYYGTPVQLRFYSLDSVAKFLIWLKESKPTYFKSKAHKLQLDFNRKKIRDIKVSDINNLDILKL